MANDEAWRGEPEEPKVPSLSEMVFGRPPTPEERQAWQDKIRAALEVGELEYPTLPRYRLWRRCGKCRSWWFRHKLIWHPAPDPARPRSYCTQGDRPCLEHVGQHEHFYRYCRRCEYGWWERSR